MSSTRRLLLAITFIAAFTVVFSQKAITGFSTTITSSRSLGCDVKYEQTLTYNFTGSVTYVRFRIPFSDANAQTFTDFEAGTNDIAGATADFQWEDKRVTVTINFPSISNGTYTFDLKYIAKSAIRMLDLQNVLHYTIDDSAGSIPFQNAVVQVNLNYDSAMKVMGFSLDDLSSDEVSASGPDFQISKGADGLVVVFSPVTVNVGDSQGYGVSFKKKHWNCQVQLSVGDIVGIVIGSVAGAGCLCFCVLVCVDCLRVGSGGGSTSKRRGVRTTAKSGGARSTSRSGGAASWSGGDGGGGDGGGGDGGGGDGGGGDGGGGGD